MFVNGPGKLGVPSGAALATVYGCGDYTILPDHVEFRSDLNDLGDGPVYRIVDPAFRDSLGTSGATAAPNGRWRVCMGGTLYPNNEIWSNGSWGLERIGMSVPLAITPLGEPAAPIVATSTDQPMPTGDPVTQPAWTPTPTAAPPTTDAGGSGASGAGATAGTGDGSYPEVNPMEPNGDMVSADPAIFETPPEEAGLTGIAVGLALLFLFLGSRDRKRDR